MHPIILIGFMASGKSSIARRLAGRLGRRARDLDALIESQAGCSVAELFAREGEAEFRRRETEALKRALQTPDVVATGGGVVTREANRELLKGSGAHIVYLQAPPGILTSRIRKQPGKRPLIDGETVLNLEQTRTRVSELLTEREPWYRECATITIPVGNCDVREAVRRIVQRVEAE